MRRVRNWISLVYLFIIIIIIFFWLKLLLSLGVCARVKVKILIGGLSNVLSFGSHGDRTGLLRQKRPSQGFVNHLVSHRPEVRLRRSDT